MKKILFILGSIVSILTLAATPPRSAYGTYPQNLEFEDTANFETIVVGKKHSIQSFGILEKHKPITFVYGGEGRKVFATILDELGDGKAAGGCLAICQFKNGRYSVDLVFFPSMYRSDGRYRLHPSYHIPENLAWYENGEFHFAPCSMVLVNYKMGVGLLEAENKIAALNAFLSPWYWPYLTFPGEIDPTKYEEIPRPPPSPKEKDSNQIEPKNKVFGESLPPWFFHPPIP